MINWKSDKSGNHFLPRTPRGKRAVDGIGSRVSSGGRKLSYGIIRSGYIDSEDQEIPEAKYFVIMKDRGKIDNKEFATIFDADSKDQAEIIKENARNSGYSEDVNIVSHLPNYDFDKYYVRYNGLKAKDPYENWYKKGFFKDDKDESYNGYKNWDTWAVALWFDNDEATYNQVKLLVNDNRFSKKELQVELEKIANNIVKDEVDWGKVNWDEIIESERQE